VISLKENKIPVSQILLFLRKKKDFKIINQKEIIKNFKSITDAGEFDMTFCSTVEEKGIKLVSKSNATFIICHESLINQVSNLKSNIIFVKNPRLDFIRCVKKFFSSENIITGIHPTAILETKNIGKNIYIGPYVQIGKNVSIGDNTIIYGNVVIYGNTKIGKNVIIDSNTVLGTDGFGFERNELKKLEKFPHFGGIEIGDNVEIGSNVSIDRGTIDNTIIENGSKIDNLVHIAHNVKIGKNCLVIANSLIAGSCIVEENCHIAMSVTLREGVKIGKNSIVGMGSIVTKNVPRNVTVFGNPAKIQEKN
jgi:UDP-3-O-[3-hydroxymyristoyl] glucosamine N-acyltransferase